MTIPLDPPAQVLSSLLITKGLGVIIGSQAEWWVYLTSLPDNPDNVISVYDTAAILSGRISKTGEVIEHPGWNIRVRASNYLKGHAKIAEIANVLDFVFMEEVAIGARTYLIKNISRTGGILPMGTDTRDDRERRPSFTLNGIMTLSLVT